MDHTTVPRRRRATKQLISQYESMSPGTTRPPTTDMAFTGSLVRRNGRFDSTAKDKSPIRSSLRNLLSVFKKTSASKRKQDEEPALSGFRRQHALSLDGAPSVPTSGSHKVSGSLLYLSRTSQLAAKIPTLPVWTSCTASLESNNIVISCLTARGNPSVHVVQLSQCTDVRSLSVHQLQPEEYSLLPKREGNGEFKVFEILFEGRPREKFATTTTQERATWVSAIWDTILPPQDGKTSRKLLLQPTLDHADSLQWHAVSAASSYSKRSLPPTPDTKPYGLTVVTCLTNALDRTDTHSPASSSVYPPTRTASLISPVSETRSVSPSVNKLSELSVVRQRLAQIESTSSQSSYEALTSPTSSKVSSDTRLTSTAISAEEGPSVLAGKQDMLRVGSGHSNAADSIVDSYGEFRMRTPVDQGVDANVGRAASKEPLDQRINSVSRPFKSELRQKLGTITETPHDRKPRADDNPELTLKDQLGQNDPQESPAQATSVARANLDIEKMLCAVTKLGDQARCNEKILATIHDKLEKNALAHDVKSLYDRDLIQEIRLYREQISEHINRTSAHSSSVTPHILNNVAASQKTNVDDLSANISELHKKLNNLMSISNSVQSAPESLIPLHAEIVRIEETLAKVLNQLENERLRQSLQAQQQESVHCLNELIPWLDSFANNGTTQLRELSANVSHLCQEIGVSGGSVSAQRIPSRDRSSATLKMLINEALEAMREQSAALSDIPMLIGQQREGYENLLRALATEISSEVKGERLRFVEAMKEATAINVQIHVEQFKNELRQEVVGMTQEIGRLYRDRQTVQTQIAELFTFYTKHNVEAPNTHTRTEQGSEKYRPSLPQPDC